MKKRVGGWCAEEEEMQRRQDRGRDLSKGRGRKDDEIKRRGEGVAWEDT